MSHYQDVEQYIKDIREGTIPACKWVKLAVERHIKDFNNPSIYFDREAGERVCNFIQLLKHTKGKWKGTYIKLEPFQKFIIFSLFAWKRKSDDTRRFRTAYITLARKNAKTTLASGIGNYMFLADKEGGAECYSIATKIDQAKISWEIAREMIKSNSTLNSKVKKYQKALEYDGSVFKPLSSDDKSEDGHSPHYVIIDEYHQHPSSGMLEAMQSGMGARTQPLTLIITTAGFDRNSACYLEEERAKQILEGSIKDDSYFSLIYSLDEGDDIKDGNNWIKANPNLNVSVFNDYIKDRVNTAISSPHKMNDILTKNFNIWTSSKGRWLNFEKWKLNNTTFPISELKGNYCYAGLDLSTSIDLTALALDFPPQKGQEKHRKIYRFFLPEDGIEDRERKDKVPYQLWNEQGYLILTPGEVIDYDFIFQEILELGKTYKIKEIAFDPYNAFNIVQKLDNEGFEMVEFRQGYVSMNSAIKNYERLVLSQQLETNDNPVMNWMVSNAEVIQDSTGNLKIDKPKRDRTGKRIDGVIADLMATDRSLANTDSRPKKDVTKTVRFISID